MQNVRQPIYFYVFSGLIIMILLGIPQSESQQTDFPQSAELQTVQSPHPTDGLLAEPETRMVYLPPRLMPGRAPQTATIHVNWNPSSCNGTTADWTPDAKVAFEYAIDIWETLIISNVPITVDACWAVLGNNVLGSASSTNIGRNYAEMPRQNTWYPIALLNSFAGDDKNGDSAEVIANFNSQFSNWYFGTDGNPKFNQYDFVSVVLHEVGHGLGFAGSMAVSSAIGLYGYGNNGEYDPVIYDVYGANGSGAKLIDSFGNGSAELRDQLISGNLYFDGAHVLEANQGEPAKIYSPNNWSQGSSFSHLDTTFDNTGNALMTHSIANGEAIHDPGDIALAMLKDLGWSISAVGAETPVLPTPTAQPAPTSTPAPTGNPSPEPPPRTEDEFPYVDAIGSEQTENGTGYPIEESQFRWQKFVPTEPVLVSAEVWLEANGSATNMVVTVSDGDDEVLGSITIPSASIKTGWNRVDFSSPIELEPGRAYKISVGYEGGIRSPAATVIWKGGPAEVYCVSCSSDVNPKNFEFSYAYRTISRIFLTESIHMPIVR